MKNTVRLGKSRMENSSLEWMLILMLIYICGGVFCLFVCFWLRSEHILNNYFQVMKKISVSSPFKDCKWQLGRITNYNNTHKTRCITAGSITTVSSIRKRALLTTVCIAFLKKILSGLFSFLFKIIFSSQSFQQTIMYQHKKISADNLKL